jgi:hypothetical protein
MAVYVTWIVGSLTVGAMLPQLLSAGAPSKMQAAWRDTSDQLPPSSYTFCPDMPMYNYREWGGRILQQAAAVLHVACRQRQQLECC